MRELSYVEATSEALAEELAENSAVFVIGPDVGRHGGIFGTTTGLQEKFGADRIREAPTFERGIVGFCIGAAMAGARPIIDLTFSDYLLFSLGDLAQQIPTIPQLSGGSLQLPLVIRASIGAALASGPFHSGNYHAAFLQIPGLRVVAPSGPLDGKLLLKAAIRCNEPVLLLEHKQLLNRRENVPSENGELVELNKAQRILEGTQATVISYGATTQLALQAARQLAEQRVAIEVIDLRSLAPLDMETILTSVCQTGRVLIVDDAPGPCTVGAEIAAQIAQHAIDYLDAPVLRLTAGFAPSPYSPALEASQAPNADDVVRELRQLLAE